MSYEDKIKKLAQSELDDVCNREGRALNYLSMIKNSGEHIGTEYGDRVLYELIQNAHDAHQPNDDGRISIRLVIRSKDDGDLYIANGGSGFTDENFEAITKLSMSSKTIGEGIGNKGIGFKSIDILTKNVQIFSQAGKAAAQNRFNGYCFRFASEEEIRDEFALRGNDAEMAEKLATAMPRYFVPTFIEEQPDEITTYARQGYATIIVAPLQTEAAVNLAKEQVEKIAGSEAPLLLFLDHIKEFNIEIERPDQDPASRKLARNQKQSHKDTDGNIICEVDIDKEHEFLLVRRTLDRDKLLAAVQESIEHAPKIKSWLNWKGEAQVSVAVSRSQDPVTNGRFYTFLPMGEEAETPLLGHIDAPFYANLDRRNFDAGLPLNKMLVEEVAKVCVTASRLIRDNRLPKTFGDLPQYSAFDFFAWTGAHKDKMEEALQAMDSSVTAEPAIPIIAKKDGAKWASLSEVKIWPKRDFAVLNETAVAQHTTAKLVSNTFDGERLSRLDDMSINIKPLGDDLAEWAEQFAEWLLQNNAEMTEWSSFYKNLRTIFNSASAKLSSLKDREIFLDSDKNLKPTPIYTHPTSKDNTPKNSKTLKKISSRFSFLHSGIVEKISEGTLEAFIEDDLIQEYDWEKALKSIKSNLGEDPTDEQRQNAMIEAFGIWQIAKQDEKNLGNKFIAANIHVPTLSGWQPAKDATFSPSWTDLGKTLEEYFNEAETLSDDCQNSHGLMLAGVKKLMPADGDEKEWKKFLKVAGVIDGLRPVAGEVIREGTLSYPWESFLRYGDSEKGFDKDWCDDFQTKEVLLKLQNKSKTNYKMEAKAWRLPGQLEHDELPVNAKEKLYTLILEHLKTERKKYFEIEVKKGNTLFYRLPTPLASFIRRKAWMPVDTLDGQEFRALKDCWASRKGPLDGAPKSIRRLSPELAEFSKNDDNDKTENPKNFAFDELKLRDWRDEITAADRLYDLAKCEISSNNLIEVQTEYRRGWKDFSNTEKSLSPDLNLLITRGGKAEILCGSQDVPVDVIVIENTRNYEAQILIKTDLPILEVGTKSIDKIVKHLEKTGAFAPRKLHDIDVEISLDGEKFTPKSNDQSFLDEGLDWLPEVIYIGHKIQGSDADQDIVSSKIDPRLRSVKIRYCNTIKLLIDDKSVDEKPKWYFFEDEKLPTLILTDKTALNWDMLGYDLSKEFFSRLIDTRLTSPKDFLRDLTRGRDLKKLGKPTDQDLADAFGCDVEKIRLHRADFKSDMKHVLEFLLPVVAYHANINLSEKLSRDSEKDINDFDKLDVWLQNNLNATTHSPKELIEACKSAENHANIYKKLELNFRKFNAVLTHLGIQKISYAESLRQSYEAYRTKQRSEIIDRLRRHYINDYKSGNDLAAYIEQKNLENHLPFDDNWALRRERLKEKTVERYISAKITKILGKATTSGLPKYGSFIKENQTLVQKFTDTAPPILRTWCQKNDVQLPELWNEASAIKGHLENTGLLDFEAIKSDDIPSLCQKAGCWPSAMPMTLDKEKLGLDDDAIKAEENRREQDEWQQERDRDKQFSEIIKAHIKSDESLSENSNPPLQPASLKESNHTNTNIKTSGGRGGSAPYQYNEQLSDFNKQEMGEKSEHLAWDELKKLHPGSVDENCWVSKNREKYFGGKEGDDSLGYDFEVKTPEHTYFYEVKSSLKNSCQFEMTANEVKVAAEVAAIEARDGSQRYRVLYYCFDTGSFTLLPNPMGEDRNKFKVIRHGSTRFGFEIQTTTHQDNI